MQDFRFEPRVFASRRLGRRLAACIGLSMLLHLSLVLWVKRDPIVANIFQSHDLFAFEATLRRSSEEERRADTSANWVNDDVAARPAKQYLPAPPNADRRKLPNPQTAAPTQQQTRLDDAARSVNDGPPAAADQGPRIDLEQARQTAREFVRKTVDPRFDAAAGAANLLEAERPGARTIAKGARPDCRTEYAEWGLLAIPLLIRDTVANSGCKW